MPFDIWTASATSNTGTQECLPLSGSSPVCRSSRGRACSARSGGRAPTHAVHPCGFAGDIISSLTHWSTAGLRHINADYTVAMSRLPEGEYIGLAAHSYYGNDGVGTGTATLFDSAGPIGTGTVLALAQPLDAFQLSQW